MKTRRISILFLLLIILLFANCAWEKYTAFDKNNTNVLDNEEIAVVICRDDNLKITRIDGKYIRNWGWDRDYIGRCILEFLPGEHKLSMTYLEEPSNIVGTAAPEQYTIRITADVEAGRIYLLDSTLSGDKHIAKLEDATENPKYQKIVEANY